MGRRWVPRVCPAGRLGTDNGSLVAWTGGQRLLLGLGEAPPTAADDVELFVDPQGDSAVASDAAGELALAVVRC